VTRKIAAWVTYKSGIRHALMGARLMTYCGKRVVDMVGEETDLPKARISCQSCLRYLIMPATALGTRK
jgi:hypothetical protein